MKVAIIYGRLYELDGTTLSIGGIQTYLLKLAELVLDLGWEPIIFQQSDNEITREVGRVKILGKNGLPRHSTASELGVFLTKHAELWIGGDNAIIIYGSDSYFANSSSKSIAIQHGVSWDLPGTFTSGMPAKLMRILPIRYHQSAQRLINNLRDSRLNQLSRAWAAGGTTYSKMRKAIHFMVCVDYNYLNVQKAQGRQSSARTWIIPNFAELARPEEINKRKQKRGPIKILFARRFIWFRGTRLIAPVFKRLLTTCPDVHITFAGEGPDESWLRDYFSYTNRVVFLKYGQDESASILLAHDIAVIPSLGSEGTSLAAIEAMATGCAVVATCVGGLTNIILDGYNGKLVTPDEDEIFSAMHEVITDESLRHSLAERAYATAKETLNIDLWREKWRRVLLHVSQSK